MSRSGQARAGGTVQQPGAGAGVGAGAGAGAGARQSRAKQSKQEGPGAGCISGAQQVLIQPSCLQPCVLRCVVVGAHKPSER